MKTGKPPPPGGGFSVCGRLIALIVAESIGAIDRRIMELDEIAATLDTLPTVLRTLLTPIDPETLRARPEPGEWSVLEVIGHLIATDDGGFRGRIEAIVDGQPEIAGFDPWAAINERDFAALSLEQLLTELAAKRARSVAFVRSLDPTELALTADYPGHGKFAASDFTLEWPFHDQEHLRQILANLKLRYLSDMTPRMRSALADG